MRFLATAATFLAVSVGLVAADYKCAAQNIVDACLESTEPQLKACTPNDWKCLCEQSNNVLTCYNNCPGHPNQFGAQQTKDSYCNAADANQPSSSTTKSAVSKTAASSVAAATAPAPTSTSGSSSTSTGSGFAAATSGAAAPGAVVEAGSLLAAVALGLGVAL
ncbi:hypothetical protein VTN00DRAFT_4449 [Thermoascus crustaceus]|uniref:uncharacterized protein n=1 Tax=Thermoascus crustaceus TaxID=5088 RepID=UPI003742D757